MFLSKLLHFLFFFLLVGCSNSNSHSTSSPILFADNRMTINYRILIGEELTYDQREEIQSIIDQTFTEIDSIYNKWNPYSEISQLNKLAAGEKTILSESLFQFFKRIDIFVKLSGGRFDPTIEPLQQLWKKYLEQGLTPSQQEIDSLKPAIGWDKIIFREKEFYKLDDRTMLDFGGVAKGYCVDLLAERLNRAGFANLFVEWGGEIRATGQHPERRPWSIYISNLGNQSPHQALAQVNLVDQAIATSGDYYQYWTIQLPNQQTMTYCHVFNPLLLTPLQIKPGSVASASLLADDCLTADTLAKVLMLFDNVEEAQIWLKTVQIIYPSLTCWIATH